MKAEHHPTLELTLQVAGDATAKANWWFQPHSGYPGCRQAED